MLEVDGDSMIDAIYRKRGHGARGENEYSQRYASSHR